MKVKKSARLYLMIALISALSGTGTVCAIEFLRTPPAAAYAAASRQEMEVIIKLLQNIEILLDKIYRMQ